MTFPKEFKEAISQLPSKEKDKLIFRLLKKDLSLANRLLFELVNEQSVDERREEVKKRILSMAKRTSETFYSVGWLNMDVRYLSGDITEHVRITKDKFGEVELNLIMINTILEVNRANLSTIKNNVKARKFYTAVIARAFKILILTSKLHKDFWLELEELIINLGKHISNNHNLMKTAIHNGLDVNWLLQFEIPDNIIEIHKDLRQRGYLK